MDHSEGNATELINWPVDNYLADDHYDLGYRLPNV